jgi:peptide/nickel transport system substrate-binding protein
MKKLLWVMICCIMTISLVIASCGTSEDTGGKVTEEGAGQTITTETETSTESGSAVYEKDVTDTEVEKSSGKPQYGGSLNLLQAAEPDFDLINWFSTSPQHAICESVWEGDWTKGPAGGYGENLVDWGDHTNVPTLFIGRIATDWVWNVDEETNTVVTVIHVRDNVYYGQPDTEAGRIAAGRKMTTEDVAWALDQMLRNPDSQNYLGFPETREVPVEITGPDEITITHPFKLHLDSIMRLFAYSLVFPPELWDAYGYDSCTDVMNSVGTGPFMIRDYVPSNLISLKRNPNYWKTNPIGPGQGDQLPYVDTIKYIIIPDLSTQLSALRTGKLDMMGMVSWEDSDNLEKQIPEILKKRTASGQVPSAFFRMDKPPFDDVNVRKALLYGIDLNAINDSLYKGLGDLISFPYFYFPAYARLYLGLDDPAMPADVKDMYTYNPDKAKALLAEAGYPDGFKTDIVMSNAWPGCVDYYSIAKDYWAKIGVDVELTLLPDNGQLISTNISLGFDGMIAQFISPVSTYPEQAQYTGDSWLNPSRVKDPYVDQMAADVRALGVTDFDASMDLMKELTKYILAQVYAIPAPRYPNYSMWWPWLKNYSGERLVGYMVADNWNKYVWIDQDLKAEMGY